MKTRIHAIAAAAAIATAGMLFAAAPAEAAGSGTQILPGVKGYNFKASPSKLRRLCVNYWKGRYWRQKPFYGCDGVKFRYWRFDIDCRDNRPCVISHRAPIMGPDGGDGHRGGRNGNAGKP